MMERRRAKGAWEKGGARLGVRRNPAAQEYARVVGRFEGGR